MNQNHVTVAPNAPPPAGQDKVPETRPRKQRRITRACDYCHKRSIRCRPSTEESTRCQNCLDFEVSCTYDRPAKKRGTKSRTDKLAPPGRLSSNDEKSDAQMLLELTSGFQCNGTLNAAHMSIPEKWRSMMMANEGKILSLVDVYFEVVYPMYVFRVVSTCCTRSPYSLHNPTCTCLLNDDKTSV